MFHHCLAKGDKNDFSQVLDPLFSPKIMEASLSGGEAMQERIRACPQKFPDQGCD
jgi:hypothetical protein